MKKNKVNSDGIIFAICILLIILFVVLLPNMNEMVRENNEVIEEEKIPVSYKCQMTKEEDDYVLNQSATYTISDKKVSNASIHRVYVFESIDKYNTWKEENVSYKNVTGQTTEYNLDETSLSITVDIEKNIFEMSDSDLEDTFPKTYSNLLIYTQDQECTSTF